MKIKLEYPYNQKWESGYIVINSDNRRTLILYNNHDNRSSTQYARYLLSVKLKRFLTEDETVDHIDGDKTNDNIDNLQILTRAENNRKFFKKEDYKCKCPVCGKEFIVPRSNVRGDKAKERILSGLRCCSRQCVHKSLTKDFKYNR